MTEPGAEYVARPAIRGLCKYESLIDGTLTLTDVWRMNDWLDTVDENDRLMRAWRRDHPGAL